MFCIQCAQNCFPLKSKKENSLFFPTFSDESIAKWRCLYQWSNKQVSEQLNSIRDEHIEITILNFHDYPRFMVNLNNDSLEIESGLGTMVTNQCHETTDPIELYLIITKYSPNGKLIAKDLCLVFKSLYPNLENTLNTFMTM